MANTPNGAVDVSLTGDIASTLTEAVHDRPVAVAYVGDDGRPHLAFRGSTHVHGPQQLAIWARQKDSGLAAAIGSHPEVSLLYYKPGSPTTYLSFTGRAHVDPSANEKVWLETPQPEKDAHPEAFDTGVAVIIDVDTVIGTGINGFFQMVR